METVSNAFCARCTRRRRYRRLAKQKKGKAKAGSAAWTWNIRVMKLKLRPGRIIGCSTPAKIMAGFRDTYVRMMLGFAGQLAQLNTGNVFLFRRVPQLSYLEEFG